MKVVLFNRRFSILLSIAVAAAILCSLAAGCAISPTDSPNEIGRPGQPGSDRLKVGFTYLGPRSEPGWVAAQEQGRLYLEEHVPGVETIIRDSVPQGTEAGEAFEDLIAQGCQVIFSTSYEHEPQMNQVAARHPEVVFMQCAGTSTASNVGTYFGYMEQCDYLSGMVAGLMTRENQVGYIASVAVPEVYRDINAFTLGVRSVNPEASVQVGWALDWYDLHREDQMARALIGNGCDVIAQVTASDAAHKAASEAGIYAIGYNVDMKATAPASNLTSPVWNWGPFYAETVQKVQLGQWQPTAYKGGLETGMVDLAPLSQIIPISDRQTVEEARQQMLTGELQVFSGPVKDNNGVLRIPAGQEASVQDLQSMNWLAEGASSPFKFY